MAQYKINKDGERILVGRVKIIDPNDVVKPKSKPKTKPEKSPVKSKED